MNVVRCNFLFILLILLILSGCKDEGNNSSPTQNDDNVETVSALESDSFIDEELDTYEEENRNTIEQTDQDEFESSIDSVVLTEDDEIVDQEILPLVSYPVIDDQVIDGSVEGDEAVDDPVKGDLVVDNPIDDSPVEDEPVKNNLPSVVGENVVVLEDQSIVLSDLLANDSDKDADELNILDFSQHSVNGGSIELISNNVLKYTPVENFNGSDSFAYVVSDGRGGNVTAIVNIVVDAINDMPQVSGEEITILEDEAIFLAGLIENDVDQDGDQLTIEDFSQGANGGLVTLQENNVLKYLPKSNYHGRDSFTYAVSDNKGSSVVATVNVLIQEVNDLPEVIGESITMLEDESVTLNYLLDNDTDIDSDKLTLAGVERSVNGGVVKLVNDTTLSYTPAANFSGVDSFNYLVSDGRGGEAIGTVTITVSEVNDIPVAKADSYSISQDQYHFIDILANDEGIGEEVEISFVSLPENGKLKFTKKGRVVYTPLSGFVGQDEFLYQVTDKDGEASVATVSLNVECAINCTRVFSLSWEPSVSENVETYKVYYGTQAHNLDQVVELANMTAYDHIVDVKGEYFFAVSAVNDQNMESELTGIISGVF